MLSPTELSDLFSRTGESVVRTQSFEQARNLALQVAGTINPSTRIPVIGRLGVGKGKVVGFETRVEGEFKRFRLDFDPTKGPHFNVEVSKGSSRTKVAVEFPGSEESVRSRLKSLDISKN